MKGGYSCKLKMNMLLWCCLLNIYMNLYILHRYKLKDDRMHLAIKNNFIMQQKALFYSKHERLHLVSLNFQVIREETLFTL